MFKKKEEPLEEPKDKFATHEDYGYEEHYGDQYKFQQQQHQQQASPASFSQMNQPQQISEKLGNLEIVDGPAEEELEKERERLQQIKEEGKKAIEEKEPAESEEPQEEGMELNSEEEKKVDERVESILHQKGESNEEKTGTEKSGEEPNLTGQADSESEEKDLLEAEMEEEDKHSKKNRNK